MPWAVAAAVFAVGTGTIVPDGPGTPQVVAPGFLTASGLGGVVTLASFVGLVAAGQTLVVLGGGVDLSVPWVLNAAAVLAATAAAGDDARAAWALPVAVLIGPILGALNGTGVAVLSVPPAVMTLGTNALVHGLTLGVTSGFDCPTCLAGSPPILSRTVTATVWGFPGPLVVWLAATLLIGVALRWTTLGRRVQAAGTNPPDGDPAGANGIALTISLYALSGLCAALSGVLLLGYGGKATVGMGEPYLIPALAAVLLGGIRARGGLGHYLGALVSAIALTALTGLLLAKGLPDSTRHIVYGATILVILLLDRATPSE